MKACKRKLKDQLVIITSKKASDVEEYNSCDNKEDDDLPVTEKCLSSDDFGTGEM